MTDAPTFPPAVFDRLRAALDASGPIPAIDRLCDELRAAGDFQAYFYAKLMRKRVELGVPPFPTGPATDLPADTHEKYEDAIREAGREVGRTYLDRGDIAKAWAFYRLIGEPGPVREALETYSPGEDDDPYPVIDVAWQQAVHPQKGFDLVLDRNGICSAITMVHSSDLSANPDLRTYCIRKLVTALHEQLDDRLRDDLNARGESPPAGASVPALLAVRDDLFADDGYHVDVSHLSSVVQMAMHLPPGPELDLARELCAYGEKLSPTLKGDNDPPFDDTYSDFRVYLDLIAGIDVDAGLAHFRRKADAGRAEGYTYPAEVLVTLLLKRDRVADALAVANEFLADVDEPSLTCPGVSELARRCGDYATLAETARSKSDPVTYLAGLIAGRAGAR